VCVQPINHFENITRRKKKPNGTKKKIPIGKCDDDGKII
jgi:hypothetical protein